jgi:uncharacterized protein YeeX (DUF496 family)
MNNFVFMQNTCIMPTLQIRDLPQELYDELSESAEINRRSLTQQAIVCLEIGLQKENKVNAKQKAIEHLNQLRDEIKIKMTSDDIIKMIREDRDR